MDKNVIGSVVGGLIGIVGVLVGILVSELLFWLRAKRRRAEERRMLAGALVAEMRGLSERWKHFQSEAASDPLNSALVQASEGSYFCIYDSAGARLSLLPTDVIAKVVGCYLRLKTTVDQLRNAARLANAYKTGSDAVGYMRAQAAARQSVSAALEYGNSALREVETLLPELGRIAST